ncbi:uncharacterized protein LOC123306714 [Coccinella septempunctata]|uniref:uncharacterized protein LOC123306710 n=1 Tax=Coccinella septempunctata TaxID=41139 RepID=UPI001D07FA8D|nr:uncharacterized protein LOC123306710 [Coccinella septempunctata]XP_044744766.1 uncharacterized protein LOC123306711 [Coccinella septempunctata]XP_044744767.1 uncharacterized protein LOC123306712 [Coccinella septempunctata]XP_044744769.1 uncharacterized protein LOC123306713 [Coccinella septempunctata]XP_044744770.1 uncharacterized protein LOC123306714 [Coccinella septempunctata]
MVSRMDNINKFEVKKCIMAISKKLREPQSSMNKNLRRRVLIVNMHNQILKRIGADNPPKKNEKSHVPPLTPVEEMIELDRRLEKSFKISDVLDGIVQGIFDPVKSNEKIARMCHQERPVRTFRHRNFIHETPKRAVYQGELAETNVRESHSDNLNPVKHCSKEGCLFYEEYVLQTGRRKRRRQK